MIPHLPADPRNREELKDWLERREQLYPGLPLTPREYLMVQGLQQKRPAYSIT
jgi:hypothetical protein